MHEHRYDERIETLRPAASRIDQNVSAHTGKAAASGRTDALGAEEILGLQRSIGNAGVSSMLEEERSPVHDVISSGGRPLEPEVRTDMEARMGHDFSDVRVHDDSAAAASASAVNAHAYTVGSNIVFQRDTYNPGSNEGRTTLAHELTHVVQQRSGPVDGTSAPGGIKVSDPSDRFEREAASNADQVMSARPRDVALQAGYLLQEPDIHRALRAEPLQAADVDVADQRAARYERRQRCVGLDRLADARPAVAETIRAEQARRVGLLQLGGRVLVA